MATRPRRPGPTPQLRRWLHHYNKPQAIDADVIIIGLGPIGCATAYHLATRGMKVFCLGHPSCRGGHPADQAAYSMVPDGRGPEGRLLAQRAKELWAQVEGATDGQTRLRLNVGLLHLTSHMVGADSQPDQSDRLLLRRASHSRVELERLDVVDVCRCYPALSPPADTRTWLEPAGGLIRSERALTILMGLARRRGATRALEEVVSVRPDGDGIAVVTTQQTYRAARVVVAAGAWSAALMGLPTAGLRLVTQEQHWFGMSQRPAFSPSRLPAFRWRHGPNPLDVVEGFPIDEGCELWPPSPRPQFKAAALVGIDDYAAIDPHPPDDEWNRGRAFRRERLGTTIHSLKDRNGCAYYRRWIVTHDGNYVVDRAPIDPRIIMAFGGPVDRFHDSIAVGEHIAGLVTGTDHVRPAFALNRPALTSR